MLTNIYDDKEAQTKVEEFLDYAETNPNALDILKREKLLMSASEDVWELEQQYELYKKQRNMRKNLLRQNPNDVELRDSIKGSNRELDARMLETDMTIATELGLDPEKYSTLRIRPFIKFEEVSFRHPDLIYSEPGEDESVNIESSASDASGVDDSGHTTINISNSNVYNNIYENRGQRMVTMRKPRIGTEGWVSVDDALPPFGKEFECIVAAYNAFGVLEYHTGYCAGRDDDNEIVWEIQDVNESLLIKSWRFGTIVDGRLVY